MASAFTVLINSFLSLLLLVSLSLSLFLHKYYVVKGEENIFQGVAHEGEYSGDHGTDKKPAGIGVRAGISKWNAHVVVATDGSGNYRKVQEAVDRAPSNISSWRYVIYIKEGWYHETVIVEAHKTNLAFVGDGKDRSIINSIRGSPEFNIHESGALVVLASGFYAQDMTFQNHAGLKKGQAVAMRSDGDRSAFYRCSFSGYQDTLFANINRQFYRECDIVGTVDFIFGDASAVFQSCNIVPTKPNWGQPDVIVAQGKERRDDPSAIVLQNCRITPHRNLGTTTTYLARPWKPYSTVVIMQSTIDGFIDPAGFLPAPDQVLKNERWSTFREYGNKGKGADTSRRVRWPSYKVVYDPAEIEKYTVAKLINGNEWLPALGIPYKAGL